MGATTPSIFKTLGGTLLQLTSAPSASQTIRANAAGTAWEKATPGWLDASNTWAATQSIAVGAGTIPLSIKQAASPTANAFEINSSAGSGGDVFKISSSGTITGTASSFVTNYLAANAGGNPVWHTSITAGGMDFVESGVANARLFLKPGGNVGIGTSSPGAKLDVVGNLWVHSGSIFVDTILGYTGGSTPLNWGNTLYQVSNSIGIGTSGPGAKLEIDPAAGVIGLMVKQAASPTANALEINSSAGSGGDKLRVDSSGNLYNSAGISVLTGVNVGVTGSAVAGRGFFVLDSWGTDSASFTYGGGSGSQYVFQTGPSGSGSFLFKTGNGTRFQIGTNNNCINAFPAGINSIKFGVNIGSTPTATFDLYADAASSVVHKITLAASQTGNALEVNSSSGSGGDKFKINSAGSAVAAGILYAGDIGGAFAGYAGIKHNSVSNSYAFMQNSGGQTYINSVTGQTVNIRVNNGDIVVVNSSGASITGTLAVSGTTTLSDHLKTNTAAGTVPVEIKQAASPTANAFEVNSSSGSGGDVFKINSSGDVMVLNRLMVGKNGTFDRPFYVKGPGNSRVFATFTDDLSVSMHIQLNSSFTMLWTNLDTIGLGSLNATSPELYVSSGNTIAVGTIKSNKQFLNQTQTLTPGATIAWDLDAGPVATVTLGSAANAMSAPTNLRAGTTQMLVIKQDGTGSRTITSWSAVFKWAGGAVPILSAAANAVDIISFYCDGTNLFGVPSAGFA